MLGCERVQRLLVSQGEHELLPRRPELAGGPVERRERDLLQHCLQVARVSPFALHARVGDRRRLVRPTAERDVRNDDRRHRRESRPGEARPGSQLLSSREPHRDERGERKRGREQEGRRERVRDRPVELILHRRDQSSVVTVVRPVRRAPPRRPAALPSSRPCPPRRARPARREACRAAGSGCRAPRRRPRAPPRLGCGRAPT